MKHIVDPQAYNRIKYIELLNHLGHNIVHIDNTYYAYLHFNPVDDVQTEIEVIGKDITQLVENATMTVQSSETQRMQIQQSINAMTDYRRQFHKNTPYAKYYAVDNI